MMIQMKSYCLLLSLLSMIGLCWTSNNNNVVSATTLLTIPTTATTNADDDDTYCVRTYDELQDRVLTASTTANNHTRIDICTERIMFEGYLNVTNKWIDIRCRIPTDILCTFDGQRQHGFIVGEQDAHVLINSVNFVHGVAAVDVETETIYPPIYFYNSYVIMKQCSIINNDDTYNIAKFYRNMTDDNDTPNNNEELTLVFEDVTILNNKGLGETIHIENMYYSIIRSIFSNNNRGGHLAIVASNGIVLDTVFEDGTSMIGCDGDSVVDVSSFDFTSTMNATTVFKNTTFVGNVQGAKGTVLRIEDNTKVILDDVVFRNNYGPGKNTNSIMMMVYYDPTPTLKCSGTTKFCDDIDHSHIIVNGDFNPYDGLTNCFEKQFITGC